MKKLFSILLILIAVKSNGQKIDSIYFNLYTDSLKRGVHNYINVDGKSGTIFLPLTTEELVFTSNAGKWFGNSVVIDSCYKGEKIEITAVVKGQPNLKKTITVYIKKSDEQPELMTESEVIESYKKQMRRRKN